MDAEPVLEKSFVARLFDLSFTCFVTTQIVSLLYSLAILAAAIAALLILARGITSGSGVVGAGSLVFAPLTFFGIVLVARIGLETAVVVFRIGENTAYIARRCSPND